MKGSKEIVNSYLDKADWRVKENSSTAYCFGAMQKHIIAEVSKDYWLREVYGSKPEIAEAYVNGDLHIHDLGGLTLYCCGYSLKSIILEGVHGVVNIPQSTPAKHFGSILNQIANLTTIYQNEIMGAVAFNSFDTLLAPFVKKDQLSYKQVKQEMQNYIFSINSNSRAGAEPAFSNITMDITPPKSMLNEHPIIGGELMPFTYKECQEEMNLINKAFYEIMLDGDGNHRAFSYPIPTYNIHERFDWDNPNNDLLFEMAGKYGYPYFANFLNSEMDIDDARSMCCRLRLDLRELRRRNGGLFGSGDATGSIGVVTLNLPRIGYNFKGDKEGFFKQLDKVMEIAKDSLVLKRAWLQENIIDKHLVPAFETYVGTMDNHFSTIGIVGMNEMCENFFGKNILDDESKAFCLEVGEHIREKLSDFQEETGALFNYEATPAESTCYRLAKSDKEKYPDIITQGDDSGNCYYTNSCHIPVRLIENMKQVFDHQDELQTQFTGGTVIHLYCQGSMTKEQAKSTIKTALSNYKVPYVSISPVTRICEDHGFIDAISDTCPHCGKTLEKYQRVTGYIRRVSGFNPGKAQEFKDRYQFSLSDVDEFGK